LVKLPQETSAEAALVTFSASSEVAHVQPNYIYHAFSNLPNDPCFPKLWGLHNTGQTGGTPDADIDAPQAWDIATYSNIIVAVIDSGIDYTHPDLAANIWVNEAELNGESGIDDDENGYVDDIRGWDFACRFRVNCYNVFIMKEEPSQKAFLKEKGV
jgi:subtilisin family serine protease